MALRPLLLSAVVGIAALGAFHTPAARAAGSVSITIGSGSPYYGNQRPGYTFVPGHWAYGQRGRVWVPDQYVPVRGHSGYVPGQRIIYRRAPQLRPLPGGFHHQRGGYDPRRGW